MLVLEPVGWGLDWRKTGNSAETHGLRCLALEESGVGPLEKIQLGKFEGGLILEGVKNRKKLTSQKEQAIGVDVHSVQQPIFSATRLSLGLARHSTR